MSTVQRITKFGGCALPTLQFLIPTLVTRKHFLAPMLRNLISQQHQDIDILVLEDNGEMTTGEKRNRLLDAARPLGFTVFVDDDDRVAEDYCAMLRIASWYDKDCIGFKMRRYQNGVLQGEETMSLGNEKYNIDKSDDRWILWNYPTTHMCPIKAEIAKQFQFKDWNGGEDTEWQDRVRDKLNTEIFVNKVLYYYLFRAERPSEVCNRSRTWRR